MCDPNNPKLEFVNSTESEVCGLPKSIKNETTTNGKMPFNYPDYVLKLLQAVTLVNTWHINEVESTAMWDLYSNRNAGIAIQSTYKRLSESFRNNEEDVIWIGGVKYIDYERDLSGLNIIDAFTCKRLSFEHERELRAITSLLEPQFIENQLDQSQRIVVPTVIPNLSQGDREAHGKYVHTELDTLIERIYVSPLSEDWHTDLVKSIAEKYGINNRVIRSNLYSLR